IGIFHLDGIAPAPRGIPQIEVTFDIDVNGILNVSAKDKATGKEQNIRIEASSGLSEDEIKRMRDEAKANEAADKAEKERVDKINGADALCFQAEKFLRENGDKVPANVKSDVEANVASLKEAVKNQNIADIDRYSEALNKAFEAMYQAQQGAQGGPQGGPQGPFGNGGPQGGPQNPNDQAPDEQ
ncbi:MAG: Hsp70 family protein, partial [Bacteroidales bacterium]|nr:Hsp70 family protein [Bacteroidales bacterium]